MKLLEKIGFMTDSQIKAIWESFKTQLWNDKTMYDDETTMDDYGMLIYSEMSARGIELQ